MLSECDGNGNDLDTTQKANEHVNDLKVSNKKFTALEEFSKQSNNEFRMEKGDTHYTVIWQEA